MMDKKFSPLLAALVFFAAFLVSATAFAQSLQAPTRAAIAVSDKALQECLAGKSSCEKQLSECLAQKREYLGIFQDLAKKCLGMPCTPEEYRDGKCGNKSGGAKKAARPPVKVVYCPSGMTLVDELGQAEPQGDAVSTFSQRRGHICVPTFKATKRALEEHDARIREMEDILLGFDQGLSEDEKAWLRNNGYDPDDLRSRKEKLKAVYHWLVGYLMTLENDPPAAQRAALSDPDFQRELNNLRKSIAKIFAEIERIKERLDKLEKDVVELKDRLDKVEVLAKPIEVQLGVGGSFTARKGPYDSYGPYVWGHLLFWGDPNDGLAVRGAAGQSTSDTNEELQWQVGGLWVHDFMDRGDTVHLRSNLGVLMQGEAPLQRRMDVVAVMGAAGLELVAAGWFVGRIYGAAGGERHTIYEGSSSGEPVATPNVSDVAPQGLVGVDLGVSF